MPLSVTIMFVPWLRRLVTILAMKAWVRFQAGPCGMCGSQVELGQVFLSSTSVYHCDSTNALYSFHLSTTDTIITASGSVVK